MTTTFVSVKSPQEMCLSTQMIMSLTLYQMSDICVSWLPLPLPVSPSPWPTMLSASRGPWVDVVCALCSVSKLEQNWNGTWGHSMFKRVRLQWHKNREFYSHVICIILMMMTMRNNTGCDSAAPWQASQWVWLMGWSSTSPCHIPPSSVYSHCSPPHLDQWDNQSRARANTGH